MTEGLMRHRHQNSMNAPNDMHSNSSYTRMKILYLLGFTRLPAIGLLKLVDVGVTIMLIR